MKEEFTTEEAEDREKKMNYSVSIGDVFEQSGDVLVCPANPWLNLSGGVNGEVLLRCGPDIQEELHAHLDAKCCKQVAPGYVFATSAGTLKYKHLVHAVAIDVFYATNSQVVATTLVAAWKLASELGHTVIMPAIATGYGRLPFAGFVDAFCEALNSSSGFDIQLHLVLRSVEQHCQISHRLLQT